MKKILIQLGFEHRTGDLWKHPSCGIIHIGKDLKVKDLVGHLLIIGAEEQNSKIRKLLSIS